jgi:4-diphosphocytidyl-2-C-methyl-D-erythritol kinase
VHLWWSAAGVVVHAPAKLNLFFEVLYKRNDGFHEIETLVSPINLFDTLVFKEDPSGQVAIDCQLASGFQGPTSAVIGALPGASENIAVRAVEMLQRRVGTGRGARLRLVKRIPIAAGLGGGSSDAAAALMAANAGWGLGWSREQLGELAAELGSDVPLFLAGGPVICRGRGERLEPAGRIGPLHCVVVRPPAGLATARVYQACQAAGQPRRCGPLLTALGRGDLAAAGRALFNRLESAAERLSPWIERLRRAFAGTDCLGHQMTGSGTCYFGLCRNARHARRVARQLQATGLGIAFAVAGSR